LQETHRKTSPASTVRVSIATMGKDHLLQKSVVQLRMNTTIAATPSSWTSTLREVQGQLDEHEASCENGVFTCSGDGDWCVEQQSIVCQAAVEAEPAMTAPTAEIVQDALQPSEPVDIAPQASQASSVATADPQPSDLGNVATKQRQAAEITQVVRSDPHLSKPVEVASQPAKVSSKPAHDKDQNQHMEAAKDGDADAMLAEDDVWVRAASAAKAIKEEFGFMQRHSHVQGHLRP
jgi:hypothetical protein